MLNDDLISRKALLETVERYKDKKYNAPIIESLLTSVLCVIDNAPAVDAEPVRHGRWIRQDDTFTRYMCSECESKNHAGHENYCPNCGAKMDV